MELAGTVGDPFPERWRPIVTEVVHRLVLGDYAGLYRDGFISPNSDPAEGGVGYWIEDYPATLVDLPPEAWLHCGWILMADGTHWAILVDLWTAEEGRSDLTMEAKLWDDGSTVSVVIDDVHVM